VFAFDVPTTQSSGLVLHCLALVSAPARSAILAADGALRLLVSAAAFCIGVVSLLQLLGKQCKIAVNSARLFSFT